MAANKSTVAFAFDIDGVLRKGPQVLPGARETLKKLQENDIPFIFLTNNGGRTEKAHVDKLSEQFSLTITEDQFVQSHSPFKGLVNEYKDKRILALGGHGSQVRDLAKAYGFKDVVISSDVLAEYPFVHPFPEMTKEHHDQHSCTNTEHEQDKLQNTKISAIFMWTSSRDWCLDLQIIKDLLLSRGGYFGTRSIKNGDSTLPNNGYQQDDQPKLFFSNPDVEWVTPHDHPRLAQGAFRESLKAIWMHETNGKAQLEYTQFGKPTEATYKYAEEALLTHNEAINEKISASRKIRTVYMIGDNPESDIEGANNFQSPHGLVWKSVLCHTGVYEAGTEPRCAPTHQARNVQEAAELALRQEGIEMELDAEAGDL